MKRRNFLKVLPALSATPLALAAMQTPSPTHSRHLIALGTASCRLAVKEAEKLNFDSITLIDDELSSQVDVHSKFFRFSPPKYLYEPYEHVRFLKKGPLPILPIPQDIETYLRTLEGELVFLAGLGNATGTLLTQSIGSHYSNPSQTFEWLVMMPFAFEGLQREHRAQIAIRVLAAKKLNPTPYYLDEIRKKYGNLAIRSAYLKADEWLVSELNKV